MPREPDVFGQPTRPKSSSAACTTRATSRTCDHAMPGTGIEIDAQLVGMIEIVGAHRMRMQLEAREVGHPGERRGVARHDFFRGPAGREAAASTTSIQSGRDVRRALLVEELAADAVRDSAPARSAGRPRRAARPRHGQVVARQIELRVAGLREQHLARVRNRDLAAGDGDRLSFGAARHECECSRRDLWAPETRRSTPSR